MIPLAIFLLACAAVYLGAIEAAFSALMRLSLRLVAERSNRPGALGAYLDDPLLLFIPVRLLLGLVTGAATALVARLVGVDGAHTLSFVVLAVAAFVVVCELLLPLLIVGRDPERVLEILLPTFAPVGRALGPLTGWIARSVASAKRSTATADEAAEEANEAAKAYIHTAEEEGLIEGEERRLLQSIVDFGDTLVREVMTPRPDIVAIRETATVGELGALFREQEYSRFPVYKDSLDNIAGFIFIKDLVALGPAGNDQSPIGPLVRPAVVVPETKRVPELLKQFQRQQTQCAIVVDEYGGTAGLVTIEDLLEEIVGEIRDEYDVESEPIVDEGNGRFVFSGKVDVDEVAQRLNVEIEREGFETVGGYLLSHIGRVPAIGERFDIDGLRVEILDAERRRITKVRICKVGTAEDAEGAEVRTRSV
jgi:putative hemolysin